MLIINTTDDAFTGKIGDIDLLKNFNSELSKEDASKLNIKDIENKFKLKISIIHHKAAVSRKSLFAITVMTRKMYKASTESLQSLIDFIKENNYDDIYNITVEDDTINMSPIL